MKVHKGIIMEKALEVIGLNKKLNMFSLNDVNFSVIEGHVVGFIGVNGAGKTTTIKTIMGLMLPDSGKIRAFGLEINKNEVAVKDRIGLLLEDCPYYEDLSLSQMKSILSPAYSNWDEKVFQSTIKRFQLPLSQKIGALSKGMKMKYSLALALSHHADLLIMDEPNSGLDPLIRSELMILLREFVQEKKGKSVLFSSHITSDIEKVADDVIMINDGKILFCESLEQLMNTYKIINGKVENLSVELKKSLLNLNESGREFTGLTKNPEIYIYNEKIQVRAATIEDIMLNYIDNERSQYV